MSGYDWVRRPNLRRTQLLRPSQTLTINAGRNAVVENNFEIDTLTESVDVPFMTITGSQLPGDETDVTESLALVKSQGSVDTTSTSAAGQLPVEELIQAPEPTTAQTSGTTQTLGKQPIVDGSNILRR